VPKKKIKKINKNRGLHSLVIYILDAFLYTNEGKIYLENKKINTIKRPNDTVN
jgi:hypothetical protein